MQACQPAAGLALHRLPFSPWANQTELWEGHPRLWCLCQRGNSAWQLLAFRQQPVFMEIILSNSHCSRLLLIKAGMKTKLSIFFFLSFSPPVKTAWNYVNTHQNVHLALEVSHSRARKNSQLTFTVFRFVTGILHCDISHFPKKKVKFLSGFSFWSSGYITSNVM